MMIQHDIKPSISVIVPVYKTEEYIDQCVISILAQSEPNYELLLVEDGSPDNCAAICDEYAKKDPRIRVIHKSNGGVSDARNVGLDYAKGTFIVFIDSDDFVDNNYLEKLLLIHRKESNSSNTMVITDYQPFTQEGEQKRSFPTPFLVNFSEQCPAQTFRDLVFGYRIFPPYCKRYYRELIEEKQLRFDTRLKSAEDFDFNIRYMEGMSRIVYEPHINYHYRIAYKKYKPSNGGVLGDSEIRGAHIMANGITKLAKKMGVYKEVEPEICRWVADKHYRNRIPMLFAENKEVNKAERKKLYYRLISDQVYRDEAKKGIRLLESSTTRRIARLADTFEMWNLFYKRLNKQQ